jgi:hypothetical protein
MANVSLRDYGVLFRVEHKLAGITMNSYIPFSRAGLSISFTKLVDSFKEYKDGI